MTLTEVIVQQAINGLSNGLIIALIALGYTMVYGIIELINFAHGDLVMLGSFLALTVVGVCGFQPPPDGGVPWGALAVLLVVVPLFSAGVNVAIDRLAYRPLRTAPKLTALVSAIGISFILVNLGLFWGGLPLEVFGNGKAAASPKDFPDLLGYHNLFGDSEIQLTAKDLLVLATTLPLMAGLTWFVTRTRMGTAMRACAQDPTAAALMGVDVDRVVSATFFIGGALAGVASVVWCLYNNSLGFQMGYRVGVDAFTAAVLGGIGNLPGAVLGGIAIGLIRAFSDQWIATAWTNVMVFAVLIGFLIFRPNGILGTRVREKV
jgi:branched-chain amino acid transport system permease protein